ncbi:MAG TPA: TIGR01212 family radical SAM protein [Drouetiella sp.]
MNTQLDSKPPETHSYRYRTFNEYLKEYFGTRVYRVPIDAGFTCPNRDGVRAFGGCTFCDEKGSGAPTIDQALNVREQLVVGMERIVGRYKAKKFLGYFQAFTNTYAPVETLRSLYDVCFEFEDVVGLCIGTRPDCLPDNVLDLLEEYDRKTFVWLEVGLQTIHDRTLDLINRGHSSAEFFDALERAKKRNLKVATHLIFGLPGETEAEMFETVKAIANSSVDAVKIHQLCVYKGTPMERDLQNGLIEFLPEEKYVQMVCDALEMLPPHQVIMRLSAEGSRKDVVGPEWCFDKRHTKDMIDAEMARRGTYQGSRYVPA